MPDYCQTSDRKIANPKRKMAAFFSVAFRKRALAATLYGGAFGRIAKRGGEENPGCLSGFCKRLSGNPGRNFNGREGNIPACRRRKIRNGSLLKCSSFVGERIGKM